MIRPGVTGGLALTAEEKPPEARLLRETGFGEAH